MSAQVPILCLVLGLAVTAPAAAQALPEASADGSGEDTLEYWTVTRMRSAVPLPQEVPVPPRDGDSGAIQPNKSTRGSAAPPVVLPDDE